MQHAPAARRRLAAHGQVAPQRDQRAAAGRLGDRLCRPVGGQRLRGCAQVELDPAGNAHQAARHVELDLTPGVDGSEAWARASSCRARERGRTSGRSPPREAGRRVSGSTSPSVSRAASSATCSASANSLETATSRPAARVGDRELAVGAEPAARHVDPLELVLEQAARAGERSGLRRPRRRRSSRERETTPSSCSRSARGDDRRYRYRRRRRGGRCCRDAGDGVGAARSSRPATGTRAGAGAITSGCEVRRVCGGRTTWWRGWVDEAATAVKAAVRPAASATAAAVVLRIRPVAASRKAAARPIEWSSAVISVEQWPLRMRCQ